MLEKEEKELMCTALMAPIYDSDRSEFNDRTVKIDKSFHKRNTLYPERCSMKLWTL